MLIILLVGKDATPLSEFMTELSGKKDIQLSRVGSAKDAWTFLHSFKVDVIVTDAELAEGSPLAFVKEVARERPLVNCAMVSNLPPKEFHEVTEGLGVFMQLPENPGKEDAFKMLQILESINALMAT